MRRLRPLLLLPLLAACASTASGGSPPSDGRVVVRDETAARSGDAADVELDIDRRPAEGTVNASADRVWAALPRVYAALGIDGAGVMSQDPAARRYGRQNLRLHRRLGGRPLSRVIECGSTYAGDADTYAITMSVVTEVRPAGEAAKVSTWLEASGRQQTASSTPVRCMTKGVLERQIAGMLADSAVARANR
ncbi:MAG TPA: hypothetical protein VF746_21995 [Longimicrobium sp.]|jgi:hypothetical protein